NETAKKHAETVSSLVQLPAGVLDAIGKADQATPALNDEVAKIDADINAVQSGQDCFNDAINALESEQSQFVLHFMQQFQTIHDQFNRSAANIPDNQPAGVALNLLQEALNSIKKKLDEKHDPLTEADLTTLQALVDAVNKAVKDDTAPSDITRLQAGVPPAQGRLRTWFSDLLKEINGLVNIITKSQDQSQPPQGEGKDAFSQLGDIAANLLKTTKPGTRATPDLKTAFSLGSDTVARSLLVLKPGLGVELLKGWGNIKVELPVVEVYAFRVRASLFGYNAPKLRTTDVTSLSPSATGLRFTEFSAGLRTTAETGPRITEATNAGTAGTGQRFIVAEDGDPPFAENSGQVDLDASYDQIVPSSWVAVQRPGAQPVFARAGRVSSGIGLSRYGMTGKTTEISLNSPNEPNKPAPWFDGRVTDFNVVRGTLVWAQAERLTLAEEPITESVGPSKRYASQESAGSVVLDGYFDGLTAGRFVAVTGERTKEDVGVEGIVATELALIAAVEQRLDASLPGDTLHTRLVFAVDLQHQYKRETVKLNANVAHATHGATQKEVLGSGDGSRRFQSFTLSKPPLTYLSKPTPSGAESALQVRVNDILWHEADNLAGLGPDDRKYIVDIEDDDTTRVVFGDGVHGSRLPTGTENVRSVYRSGIGKPGNVVASKINILPSPPLGVTAVNNPAPATGGADPETRDQARRNAPVAVLALDRLVSVRDYADFARTFAGIAKANSSLEKGTVTVTVAGSDDIPIDTGSDLFKNLSASLEEFGDPHQIVKLQMRKLKILVLQMGVVVDPRRDFDIVKDEISAALLDRFGFDQQELGEPVILSRVLSVGQRVPGVEYLDVDLFGAIQEPDDPDPNKVIQAIEDLVKTQITGQPPSPGHPNGEPPTGPAQFVATGPNEIAYFSPALPETIVLKQLVPEGNQ
ncbi:MAG TPA: putative baseplate assembly protein, partial [Pyrinomonadaceae bacterium]|nr:putative baseplate assembly protein [Pyrinomonadaceae bacterium]